MRPSAPSPRLCGGSRRSEGDDRGRQIEIEVADLEQLAEALEAGVDRIMLDNMPLDMMREAVLLADARVPLEASGGITWKPCATWPRQALTSFLSAP